MSSTGNQRAKRLYDNRIASGQKRLNDWLSPEAAKKLEALCKSSDETRAQVLERLILQA